MNAKIYVQVSPHRMRLMHEGLTLDNKHTIASYNLLDLHEKPYVILKFVAIKSSPKNTKNMDEESELGEDDMRNIWDWNHFGSPQGLWKG